MLYISPLASTASIQVNCACVKEGMDCCWYLGTHIQTDTPRMRPDVHGMRQGTHRHLSQHKLTIEQGIPHRALNCIHTAHATKRDRGTVCRRTDGLGRLAARGVEERKRGRGRGIRVQRRGGEEWREGEFGCCCLCCSPQTIHWRVRVVR